MMVSIMLHRDEFATMVLTNALQSILNINKNISKEKKQEAATKKERERQREEERERKKMIMQYSTPCVNGNL